MHLILFILPLAFALPLQRGGEDLLKQFEGELIRGIPTEHQISQNLLRLPQTHRKKYMEIIASERLLDNLRNPVPTDADIQHVISGLTDEGDISAYLRKVQAIKDAHAELERPFAPQQGLNQHHGTAPSQVEGRAGSSASGASSSHAPGSQSPLAFPAEQDIQHHLNLLTAQQKKVYLSQLQAAEEQLNSLHLLREKQLLEIHQRNLKQKEAALQKGPFAKLKKAFS